MSRTVSDERLEIMHLLVSGALRQVAKNDTQRTKPPVMVQVDARDLSPLLDELRRRRASGKMSAGQFKLSPTTVALMTMKVGETIDIPPMPQSSLTTLRSTARKKMNCPDANWHSESQADGFIKVTRLPDGSPKVFGKPRNPMVAVLAGMKPSEKITVTRKQLPFSKIPIRLKHQARAQMDKVFADWKCTNLANGKTRIERIS